MDRNVGYGAIGALICVVLLLWIFSGHTGAKNMAQDAAHDVKQMGQDVKSDLKDLTH